MIKVGIIGFGKSAKIFHLPSLKILADKFTVTAFLSSQEELIRKEYPNAKVYSEIENFLNDPQIDLVIITSPNHLHYEQAKASLIAGKHVIIEKPFVVHPEDGEELINIAKTKNLKLSVYHNRRWDKGFLSAQELINNNSLGDIYHYETHFDRWRPEATDNWRNNLGLGSGLLYDLGSHLIDQALFLFGEPDEIIADLDIQRPNSKSIDYFHLIFKYKSKMRAILHASCLTQNPGNHITVHGSKGTFIEKDLDPQENNLAKGLAPTSYQNFYKQMAEAISENASVPVEANTALSVIKIIHKILQTAS